MTPTAAQDRRAARYGIQSNDEQDVPLHLLPLLILQFVRQTGTRIYRISVKRTRWRAYNVSVRTRSKLREREPEPPVLVPPGPVTGNGDSAAPVPAAKPGIDEGCVAGVSGSTGPFLHAAASRAGGRRRSAAGTGGGGPA